MRDDEFNFIAITNEKDGFSSFEFGHTQNNESTSFSDNKNNIRDEVNDNPTSNNENNKKENKRREERKEESKDTNNESKESSGGSSSNSSSGSSSSSASSSGVAASSGASALASVVGAAVISVGAVAAAVGINVFTQCKMNALEATYDSINYDLELNGISDSKYSITIRGVENVLLSYHDLEEGVNTGEFTDLNSDTEYTLSVVNSSNLDLTVNDWTWTKNTLKKDEPVPPGPVVDKVILTPHETSINCAFDIFDNDSLAKYKVELYNDGIDAHFEKDSQIGHNELEFTDLASSTEYTFEIFRGNPNEQQEYTYESIYSEVVSTLEYTGSIVLSFDSDERQGTMSSIELDANKSYTLPVSIFVPRDDEYFAGWKISGEGELLQPGQTVSFNNDTTLVAGWNKFPTEETVVQAGSNLFTYFPSEPSPIINTISLMGVDFQYQYTSYDIASEALQLASTGGFVSTSTPFGGPISKISITTDSTQSGEVNYTIVYSEYPIYEKTTEGGETVTLDSYSTYTFNSINPDARYFCLSNESSDIDARIMTMEFAYLLPVIENSFQVYFDANGGKGTYGPYTVSNKNRDYLPDIEDIGFEAPDGYEFAGWKVKGVNDLLEADTLIGISSDITLVAQWKQEEPKTKYTITFEPNGGSFDPLSNIEAALGEVVNLPEKDDLASVVPSSDNTFFGGWSEEPGGRVPVNYSYTVNGDTSLYAIWRYGYELKENFEQFVPCEDTNTVTDIDGKGSFLYRSFDKESGNLYMGYGTEAYFSNNVEEAQPIESVILIFGEPITVSVSFSTLQLFGYNYDGTKAHDFNPSKDDVESYEFVAPSDAEYRYFNISAGSSDKAIVNNIIINYRK